MMGAVLAAGGIARSEPLRDGAAEIERMRARLAELKQAGKDFTPEDYQAPSSFAAGVDDRPYIQAAMDAAHARYAAYGTPQAIHLIRRYELASAVSVPLTNSAGPLFRRMMIQGRPGVSIICHPGAGLHVADGMSRTFDYLYCYQEDAGHRARGDTELLFDGIHVDWNPDNQDRPYRHTQSEFYHGIGWYFNPAYSSISYVFSEYYSYGSQVIAEISGRRISQTGIRKFGVRNICISGHIEEFGRNTGPISMDTSAISVYADGVILTENLLIEGANSEGKYPNTGIEAHGNYLAGPGTVVRKHYNPCNIMNGVDGGSYADLAGLRFYDAGRGPQMWLVREPAAPRRMPNPAWSFRKISFKGMYGEIRPSLHVLTHPWTSPRSKLTLTGGVLTDLRFPVPGWGLDPAHPPAPVFEGVAGAAPMLGKPVFTAGTSECAVVTHKGDKPYTSPPAVTQRGCGGTPAKWRAILDGKGYIDRIERVAPAIRDTQPGTLTISGGGGAGATARVLGSWGIDRWPIEDGGNGNTRRMKLVVNDSANLPDDRVSTPMACHGISMIPTTGSLVGLPVAVCDATGWEIRCVEDVSQHSSITYAGINLANRVNEVWFETLLIGGTASRFPGSHTCVMLGGGSGRTVGRLELSGARALGCGKGLSSGTGAMFYITLDGTRTGHVLVARGNFVDSNPLPYALRLYDSSPGRGRSLVACDGLVPGSKGLFSIDVGGAPSKLEIRKC